MSIVDELVAGRKAAKITQTVLAHQAGLTRMTVQRVESGNFDPHLSTVYEMARTLGMDIMLVPSCLRSELEGFVRSGGLLVGQPAGVGAPLSVIDTLLRPQENR